MSERPSEFLIILIFLLFYDCVRHCGTIKCFDTVAARYKHEDSLRSVRVLQNMCLIYCPFFIVFLRRYGHLAVASAS
jgi:hypothetical protein